jgi:hypothetical protein
MTAVTSLSIKAFLEFAASGSDLDLDCDTVKRKNVPTSKHIISDGIKRRQPMNLVVGFP